MHVRVPCVRLIVCASLWQYVGTQCLGRKSYWFAGSPTFESQLIVLLIRFSITSRMRSLAVVSRPRPSEMEWIVTHYSRSISRAARSVDHTDPSIALRKHCVGRKKPRFAKVNVNKGEIFLRNRMNPTCMLFLSMHTLIIFTMRLCAQRNSCPEASDTHKQPPTQPPNHPLTKTSEVEDSHVTFLNIY